jgi:protein O-mannosyl-transferase
MNKKNGSKKKIKNQTHQKKSTQKVENNYTGKWIWFALGVAIIIAFIIYFKAIHFGFLQSWDDQEYIILNNNIKDLKWENIKSFFTEFFAGNYQPITILMYAIEYKIGSGNASIFHFSNILLHLLNTFLVFILIKRISPKNAMVALIAAAFFAVHPMHVESVAWVAERKDVLYTFFFLLSLIMYTYYLQKQKTKHIVFAFIFFLLSCMSKSAAVILPLIMLLLDYYYNRVYRWKMIIEKIPFFLISLLFGFIAIRSQKGSVQDMAPAMSLIEHISIVSFSFISYLYKAIIPVNLSAIYPYPTELGGKLPIIYYLSILFTVILLFFVWYSRKLGKDVVFGFLFFIITIILVLQFVPVGSATMAERYTYIPYIGIFFIIGKLFEYLSNSKNKNYKKFNNYLLILCAAGFIAFSTISYGRVKVWENNETLFSDAKEKYPYSCVPYFVIGDYYSLYYADKVYANNDAKREMYVKKAITEYENALKFSVNITDSAKAYSNLGFVKCYLGDFAGAMRDCDNAIKTDSTYPNSYKNRVRAKFMLQDYKAALGDCNKLIELVPNDADAFYNRAITRFHLNDYKGALEDFDMTIKIDTNYIKAYNDRGTTRFMLKNYEGALEDYNKAIMIDPQSADAINHRDMVLSIIKNSKNQ